MFVLEIRAMLKKQTKKQTDFPIQINLHLNISISRSVYTFWSMDFSCEGTNPS